MHGNKKLTIDFIRSEFEKEGYRLLADDYKNNSQKLDYVCPNGHSHSTSWRNWAHHYRCPYCVNKAKHNLDFIKSEFEKEGYTILTTKYENAFQKLDYICNNGHCNSIKWNDWQQKHRCSVCSNNAKHNLDFIKSEFEKEGYRVLTTEYKNNKQKLDCVCVVGHQYSVSWHGWQKGDRCSTCYHIRNSGKGNSNWQGGISFEPYCPIWKDKEYKSDIRERDGNRCLNPCCDSKNHSDLTIHHIDYNKKNCAPQNLITVCRSCNARANYNRKWHTEWYRAILNKKYNYKY